MTLTNRYTLGPAHQALLATMFSPPQPLLTEESLAAGVSNSTEKPAELITDFEDHRIHSIGE